MACRILMRYQRMYSQRGTRRTKQQLILVNNVTQPEIDRAKEQDQRLDNAVQESDDED